MNNYKVTISGSIAQINHPDTKRDESGGAYSLTNLQESFERRKSKKSGGGRMVVVRERQWEMTPGWKLLIFEFYIGMNNFSTDSVFMSM